MIVIIQGPQACGKGTQARLLSENMAGYGNGENLEKYCPDNQYAAKFVIH